MRLLIFFWAMGRLLLLLFFIPSVWSQSSPGGPTTNLLLDSWSFPNTNWLSDKGYAPVAFTNISNLTNILVLDFKDTSYLFYNVVKTNGANNINLSDGTISFWFNPSWASTNELDGTGTGPGDWANLISLGQYGTNNTSWWALYFDPSGTILTLSSQTKNTIPSSCFSAQVGLVDSDWYNIVVAYSPTNSLLYLNGLLVANGSGISYWPGPEQHEIVKSLLW